MITQLTNINNVPRGTIKIKVMEATEIEEIARLKSQVESLYYGLFEWLMPSIEPVLKDKWGCNLAEMLNELRIISSNAKKQK